MSSRSSNEIGNKKYRAGSFVDAFINDDNVSSLFSNSPLGDFPEYLEDEEDNSISGVFKSIRTPKRKKGITIPFTSTFFKSFSGAFKFLSNPLGFIWKFISLVIQPLFFGFSAFFFFYLYMAQDKYFSLALALVFFIESFRESYVCISDRPSLKEVIELFAHQTGLLWIVWAFSSATYALMRAEDTGVNESLWIALAVVGVVCYFAFPFVSFRVGASNIIKYLYQIIAVVLTTALITFIGYLLSPYIWSFFFTSEAIFFRSYAVAMFFGFFGFWTAVGQFYIPDVSFRRFEERGEEVLEI